MMDLTERLVAREVTSLGVLELREMRTSDGETGYGIYLDDAFLMGSDGSHSERAMAELARERLPGEVASLSVLVGGLGAGHTLRAVLDLTGVTQVDVAEIGGAVVRWNRTWLASFNDGAVDDPRVAVVLDDVYQVLVGAPDTYDLVLLDVDNGPGWLAADGNSRLYSVEGLSAARRSLRAGGVLAVWSPDPNTVLERRLSATFGEGWSAVSTREQAREAGEPPSIIYLAGEPLHS